MELPANTWSFLTVIFVQYSKDLKPYLPQKSTKLNSGNHDCSSILDTKRDLTWGLRLQWEPAKISLLLLSPPLSLPPKCHSTDSLLFYSIRGSLIVQKFLWILAWICIMFHCYIQQLHRHQPCPQIWFWFTFVHTATEFHADNWSALFVARTTKNHRQAAWLNLRAWRFWHYT